MHWNRSFLGRWRTGAATCLALLALALPAAATELTQPLTAEEVACNERQLERLLQRMNAAKERHVPPQLPTILLVSYSNSVGFYDGLVVTDQGFRLSPGGIPPAPAYEHHLAYNINPSIRTLLLNPSRPELSQVGLNREQSSSNLVTPGGYFDLSLTLDPTLGGGDPLVINNFEEPLSGVPYNGFLANSTKPGRGLTADALLTPCHEKFTDFDRHVFSALQRMIRSLDMGAFSAPDVEIAIFRGAAPQTYRVNIYPIYEGLETRGRLAIELDLSWTPTGKLTQATMTALPWCNTEIQVACTELHQVSMAGFLIPPVFGGTEYYPNDSAANGVFYIWYEGPSAPNVVNLEALLAHTTWNEPVW